MGMLCQVVGARHSGTGNRPAYGENVHINEIETVPGGVLFSPCWPSPAGATQAPVGRRNAAALCRLVKAVSGLSQSW